MRKSIRNSITGKGLWTALEGLLREIGIFALVGLVGTLLLLVLFVKLTREVFEPEFTNLDNNFALWVHSFATPTLDLFFGFFTILGGILGISFLTVITVALLLWRKHFHSIWLLILGVSGGVVINQVLKLLFQRPRPNFWTIIIPPPLTFSFPSGHAAISLCYFGVLIWLGFKFLRHPWQQASWTILLLFIIGMVGLSRIYFGVHYPTDVLAGYLSGSLWLAILFSGVNIYNHRHQIKP